MFKDKRLNDVVLPEPSREPLPAGLFAYGYLGNPKRRIAGKQDVEALRRELRALASALGYEWVPEGKTEARWRRKNPFTCSGAFGSTFEWVHADEPPALRNRRNGDKKKGRNK